MDEKIHIARKGERGYDEACSSEAGIYNFDARWASEGGAGCDDSCGGFAK